MKFGVWIRDCSVLFWISLSAYVAKGEEENNLDIRGFPWTTFDAACLVLFIWMIQIYHGFPTVHIYCYYHANPLAQGLIIIIPFRKKRGIGGGGEINMNK